VKVIFVDDSLIVLKTLNNLVADLIENGMIECEFYSDSVLVKEMIESEKLEYDILFVDINMPNVTGYDIVKTAKAIQKYRYKSIIAITTSYTTESQKIGKEVGIDGWFIKSIVTDSLQSSIVDSIKKLYKP